MPQAVTPTGTFLSRLGLLEEKLDNTVLRFCTQDDEEVPLNEVASTLGTLLRQTEKTEELKGRYGRADDTDGDAELEQLRNDIKKKLRGVCERMRRQ